MARTEGPCPVRCVVTPSVSPRTEWHPEFLMLTAVAALIAFYYLGRTDIIGVFSSTRGWTPMTGRPLPSWAHFGNAALVLGVVPALAARYVSGLSWRALGLGLGNWRVGVVLLLIGVPLAVIAGRIGADNPVMRAVYPLDPAVPQNRFVAHAALQFLYFGAWEVLFRGVLLFGLARSWGGGAANVIQTALSVTAHFGRALTETFAALPAGLVFGWASLRTGSIWYIAIIHWTVGVSMDWFIVY